MENDQSENQEQQPNENNNQGDANQEGGEQQPVLEDAPMGSDHDSESQQDGDFVYVDDDEMAQLEAMADEDEARFEAENQGDVNDFETFQEDEFAEGDEYEDGQVISLTAEQNDSIAQFNEHHDSVYCVDSRIFSDGSRLFASGDGADKAYVWKINAAPQETTATEEQQQPSSTPEEVKEVGMETEEEVKKESAAGSTMTVERVCELPGHTETVEFCKFDSSGKWLATGGMNNMLRIWDVANGFTLKRIIDSIPQEDLNFVEWHSQAPVLMTGGKDYMIWLVNAVNGKIMANLIGHEDEVINAKFTMEDRGKHIVSCSIDKSIKIWSPLSSECVITLKSYAAGGKKEFHESQILCFALHPEMPVILSGDEKGRVFASQYMTGEINGVIGTHTDSVESIAISKTQPIACSAGIDTKIHVYDLNNFTRRLTVSVGQYGGFTKLLFSTLNTNCLIAASTLGDISLVDPRDGSVQKTIKGHIASINDIQEFKLEDGSHMLVTAGDDNQCLVFRQQ